MFGAQLADNAPLRAEVAAFVAAGRPVLAECGGLLYLCRDLDGHEMCGAIAAAREHDQAPHARLPRGGRREPRRRGSRRARTLRGHEFHYSQVQPLDEAARAAWTLSARGTQRAEGVVAGALQASYLHVHWAAHPQLARRFAGAARAAQLAAA